MKESCDSLTIELGRVRSIIYVTANLYISIYVYESFANDIVLKKFNAVDENYLERNVKMMLSFLGTKHGTLKHGVN